MPFHPHPHGDHIYIPDLGGVIEAPMILTSGTEPGRGHTDVRLLTTSVLSTGVVTMTNGQLDQRTIRSGAYHFFGVTVRPPGGDFRALGDAYYLNYSFAFNADFDNHSVALLGLWIARAAFQTRGDIGFYTQASSILSVEDQFVYLPLDQTYVNATGDHVTAHAKGTLLVGRSGVGFTIGDVPILGFTLHNSSGSGVVVDDINATLTFHVWESDVVTYDPNR